MCPEWLLKNKKRKERKAKKGEKKMIEVIKTKMILVMERMMKR